MFSDFSSDDEDQFYEEYERSPSFYYPFYSGYDEDGFLDDDFLGLPLGYLSGGGIGRGVFGQSIAQEFSASSSKSESVFGGYDYECVVKPSEEYTCPICLLLMRDPVLTSCCGNHFCKSCNSESIKAKSKSSKCPLCKSTSYTYLVDKGMQRKILDLLAYCPKKSDGCEWQGEIRDVAKHINPFQDGCNYIEVKCKLGCNQKIVRHLMEKHISDDCPLRKITCRYCGYKESESLLDPHFAECPDYPVSCPNKCTDSKMVRSEIHNHLEKDCPMETIGCLFENSGCTAKVVRKDMTEHIDNERLQHLILLGQTQDTLKKELDKFNSKLAAYETENTSLRAKVEELKTEVTMLKAEKPSRDVYCEHDLLVAPCVMVLEKFDQIKESESGVWNGPEFYSHSNGYKMQMTVFVDDSISLVIEMVEGKYDKYLPWPMRGSIDVELLNVIDDSTHWIKRFTDVVGFRVGRSFRVDSPVVECEWFTSCKYLKFFPRKKTQYLEDNKLRFRVSVNIDCVVHRPWLF